MLAFALCVLATGLAKADQKQSVRLAVISYGQMVEKVADPIVVEPVVVVGSYALADWVAGHRQGQALAVYKSKKWQIVAMENSSLADARYLTVRYHVPQPAAAELVKEIRSGEHRQGG